MQKAGKKKFSQLKSKNLYMKLFILYYNKNEI